VRHHDLQFRKIGGDIVHIRDRARVPELHAAATGAPRADARGAGVEQYDQPEACAFSQSR